jgi:hypothetical protein
MNLAKAAERATAHIEGHSATAKISQPGRLKAGPPFPRLHFHCVELTIGLLCGLLRLPRDRSLRGSPGVLVGQRLWQHAAVVSGDCGFHDCDERDILCVDLRICIRLLLRTRLWRWRAEAGKCEFVRLCQNICFLRYVRLRSACSTKAVFVRADDADYQDEP